MSEVLVDAGSVVVMRRTAGEAGEAGGLAPDYGAAIQKMLDMREEMVAEGASYAPLKAFLERHGQLFESGRLGLSAFDVRALDDGKASELEAAGCILKRSRDDVRDGWGLNLGFELPGELSVGEGASSDGVYLVNISLEPQGFERVGCCSLLDADRAMRWVADMGVVYRAGIDGRELHERYGGKIEIEWPGAGEHNPEGLAVATAHGVPEVVFGYGAAGVEDGFGRIEPARDVPEGDEPECYRWVMGHEDAGAGPGAIAARMLAAAYSEDLKRDGCACVWERDRLVLRVGEANSFVREAVRIAADGRIRACAHCGRPIVNASGKSAKFCRERNCYQRRYDRVKYWLERNPKATYEQVIGEFPDYPEETVRNWLKGFQASSD